MDEEQRQLAAIADPVARVRAATSAMAGHKDAIDDIAELRRKAMIEAHAAGTSPTELARAAKLTTARVSQILKTNPKPGRPFLGASSTLTIAVAGKVQTDRPDPQPVVAQDDLIAYERLAELARTCGLETEYEVIRPPGLVDLNRDGLVVICGPRMSPIVAQVLAGDQVLAFEKDDRGWYLTDKISGEMYRSPMDSGEHRDVAYLGRLPRPDGRGLFLYIAGIHSAGSAGAVHYLTENLGELYRELKLNRFSVLIESTHDADTREITESHRLTPVRRPDGGA